MDQQRVLDLSKLTEFVLKTLKSTDEVRNILETQCEEAKFVLAPWQFETITKRELDKDTCTCIGIVSSEEHVREIASGIDRAVAQARKLREKLAANVSEEKKLARRPSVQEIYAPGLRATGSRTKLVDSKTGKENGIGDAGKSRVVGKRNEASGTGTKREKTASTTRHNPKIILNGKADCERNKLSSTKARRACLKGKTGVERKRVTDNKLVDPSPYNSLAAASKSEKKFKRNKNFIAANKSSVKHTKSSKLPAVYTSRNERSKHTYPQVHESRSSGASKSSDSIISRASSAAEFENLISKISLETENGRVKTAANMDGEKGCPIHDINAPKFVEEKICSSVDVAEGLDRFGIPSELVKVLKVYHNYLGSQPSAKPSDKRGQKSEGRFLAEFDTMNRGRRKTSDNERLGNLCNEFLPVMKESFNRKMDFIQLSRLKIIYTDLDTACKNLQIRNFSPTKRKLTNMVENRQETNFVERNRAWRLNSVWNEACIPNLEGMSRTRCIRYSNRNQLSELFDCMQQIQQFKYQTSLVDLLMNEVVPSVRNSLEPTSDEYVAAYKMISIISNLLNLKVPVLVRTDK